MELNSSITSSVLTSTQTSVIPQTTIITTTTTSAAPVYDDRLFLQTTACQAIAGAFTWAAILITSYQVKCEFFFCIFI
jgi:hypothetical protein